MPERILSRARPQSSPAAPPRGRILMRIDPEAIGRFTRADLRRNGYQVTSVPHLTPAVMAAQHADTILFFHHVDEPDSLESLKSLPADVPVIVATVGSQEPDPDVLALAESRGYALLNSRLGPNSHIVLRTLKQLQIHLN